MQGVALVHREGGLQRGGWGIFFGGELLFSDFFFFFGGGGGGFGCGL